MTEKGFEAEITLDETPNYQVTDEKPLKTNNNQTKKVDINVLKARVQEIQNKENKKNLSIFVFFLLALASLGIFLSA
tara:strand:- start:307 stop:537 length:231 start_codon:yes stop_codon:yes gene_type:complete